MHVYVLVLSRCVWFDNIVFALASHYGLDTLVVHRLHYDDVMSKRPAPAPGSIDVPGATCPSNDRHVSFPYR